MQLASCSRTRGSTASTSLSTVVGCACERSGLTRDRRPSRHRSSLGPPFSSDTKPSTSVLVSDGGRRPPDEPLAAARRRPDRNGSGSGQARARSTFVPDDAGRFLLARRCVRPARSRAVGGVDLQRRRDCRPQGRLRRRHLGRRADRHPVHDRARQPDAGAGVLRLRGRERPRPVSGPAERSHRGRPELDRRPPRADRRS